MFCNGRRIYRRPFPLFPLGAMIPPLWVPVLHPALFCGPLFLSILNYRTAIIIALAWEFPTALFYISAQPKLSILLVINGELG